MDFAPGRRRQVHGKGVKMRHLHYLRIVFILSVGMGVARGGLAAQAEAADSTRLFKAAISETGSDMSLEELSRDANRSLVRMEIRLATSVGGSSWIACQMAELTKHRGSRYHVVLDYIEQTMVTILISELNIMRMHFD